MATAYSLAADANLRDIGNAGIWGVATARTGSDTMTTNGFIFTQDQDSRYGLGGNTSATWGALTVHATKGGKINFDGRYIRMIPFTSGSGTITAGATITCGSGTGKVIGIYAGASMNAAVVTAPVLTGTIAAGYIKVTAWNSVAFDTSGTFTQGGYTFTIAGASVVGFMEVDAIEHATANTSSLFANRLGEVNITGEWFELGDTDATTTKTFQLPTHGLLRHSAGVFVAQTAGGRDFEFYPNAALSTTVGTEADRGKVCWITSAGVVRIGNNGSGTMGHHPGTGKAVVVGNIWFENVAPATQTANVIPNATILTRYHFNTGGGGVVSIDKCDMAWYLIVSQAYSLSLTYSGFIDAISVSEVATAMTWNRIGVGNKPTTALVVAPLTLTLCFAGGTITDCLFQRVPTTANTSTSVVITDCDGFTFTRMIVSYAGNRAHTSPTTITATRLNNSTFDTLKMIDGRFVLATCSNVNINTMNFIGQISGTTGTSNPVTAVNLSSNCLNVKIDGFALPVTNTHPYTGLFDIGVAGCTNTKIRNIGSRSTPLSLGSSSATGLIFTLAGSAAAINTKVQRVYCSNTRTGIMTGDNSSKGLLIENVFGDYADSAMVAAVLDMVQKGLGTTHALTATTGIYGTHWLDYFTSTTVGRIAVLMNEPTATTTAQVTLANGAAFTSAGGLYMPTVGHTATFETPHYILGHTSFSDTPLVMGGGTATNYTYEYSIDKNDGNSWSTLTSSGYTATQLGTALNGISGIDASKGIKLRVKVTTGTSNTTAISSFYVVTVTSTTAQDYQYPLDINTLTLTGLISGSDVTVTTSDTNTVVGSVDQNTPTSWVYTYSGAQTVDIKVIKAGYVPYMIFDLALTTTNASIPISQTIDRAYQ